MRSARVQIEAREEHVASIISLCKLKKLSKMGSLRRNFWTLVERLGVAFRVLKRTKGEVDLHGLHVLL